MSRHFYQGEGNELDDDQYDRHEEGMDDNVAILGYFKMWSYQTKPHKIGTRYDMVVEEIVDIFKRARVFGSKPGPFLLPGSVDVAARWMWKQLTDIGHQHHLIHRGPADRWRSLADSQVDPEVLMTGIIEMMIKEGALRVWVIPNRVTKELESSIGIDKPEMDTWLAARLLVLSDNG